MRAKIIGWWAEYRCGCVSPVEKRKKDVLDYCGKHGNDRRYLHPEFADESNEEETNPPPNPMTTDPTENFLPSNPKTKTTSK